MTNEILDAAASEIDRIALSGDEDDITRAIRIVAVMDMRLKSRHAELIRDRSLRRAEDAVDTLLSFGHS